MKITVQLPGENALNFMRRAGYGYQKEGSSEVAFTRRVSGSPFPRYHAYTQQDGARITVNLHIDQKETTYQGGRAHSGEYDGPLITEECNRLRAFAVATPPIAPPNPPEPKRGFFGKLFG